MKDVTLKAEKNLVVDFDKTNIDDVLDDNIEVVIKGKFKMDEITHLAFLFQMWGGHYKIKSKK